jgi:hypothetical protein
MPKTKKKRKLLIFFLGLLIVYISWLSFHLILFKSYKPGSKTSSSHEIVGVYHIHSTLSDGKKEPDEIAHIAARSGLDFIILTDHGEPNFASLKAKGWKEGLLMLSGAEMSVNRGHLVGLGFKTPSQRFSENAEKASHQVNALNGYTIIAHPYSKTSWSWGKYAGYSGIEIINADSMLKKNIVPVLPFLPALFIKPELPLLKMLDRPEKNLRKWDMLNRSYKTYGYFSTDAHLLYKPLFAFLRLHVLLIEPLASDFEVAENQVYSALKKGRFFNAADAAAYATGFRFWGKSGSTKIPMGASIQFDSPVTLNIQLPSGLRQKAYLICNGKSLPLPPGNPAIYVATQPGVYRVEVFLKERTPLSRNCPWIISNPIFLREKNHEQDQPCPSK